MIDTVAIERSIWYAELNMIFTGLTITFQKEF
jgi:hypothetical protein